MARLGKCPKCGTKRWKKNNLGFYICKYGHQLENYQEEQGEAELTWAGTTRRKTLKRKRENESKEYFGAKAQFLLFQAFQHILRQQIYVLINELGLPAKLEEVVQELWLLYVSSTNLTCNEEMVDTNTTPSQSQSQSNPVDEVDLEFGDLEFGDLQKNSDDPHVTFNLATSNNNTDDGNAAYVDETSGADSEPGKVDSLGFQTGRRTIRRSQGSTKADPRRKCLLQFTIVICYLGCVWCRVPVLLADLHRLAAKGTLPYSSAYMNFPDEMREHFYIDSLRSLDTKALPECPMLHTWTSRFIRFYRQDYGIEFPRLNGPLVIYRHIRELLLPVELYTAATNLATLLSDQLSKAEKAQFGAGPVASFGPSPRPCVNFMAIVLVMAKLCYGLDDRIRWV
ncbi:hypothetical protein BC937DRAFT_90351 [Endogone sp. FLAS-F59071]|nr:hypothetical protein BC937DRAFT_90351 [Endogone sp. FLAS-F59071]|eukprot:RUS23232.1 hypothetical protein BC937DRAFT_90351 [Endogone sp. FLAS-F59071]